MLLKKFDFLSPNIHLYFKNKKKHSSCLSGLLSIVLIIIIILVSLFFSKDFLLRQNPTSSFYKRYLDDVDYISFNSSGIFHYITFNTISGLIINKDNNALSIIGLDVNTDVFITNTNISKYNFWIYELCDEDDIGELIGNLNNNETNNYFKSYCIHKYYNKEKNIIFNKNDPEFKEPYLQHGNSRLDNIVYGAYIIKCQNFTIINNNSCYSISKINEVNQQLFNYAINILEYSVDVHNYKKPLLPFIHRIQNEFSKYSFTLNHLNFKQFLLNSDVGYFLNVKKNYLSYEFYQNEKLTEYDSDELNIKILGSFNFWMSNELGVYERHYIKIQEVAGGLSGIIRILILLFTLINKTFIYFYNIAYDFNKEFYNRNSKELNKSNSICYDNSNITIFRKKKTFIKNINKTNIFTNQRFSVENKKVNFKIPLKKKIQCFYHIFGKYYHFCTNDLYVNFILNIRKSLLSEERFIKQFYILKKLKQFNVSVYKHYKNHIQSNTQISSNNGVISFI